MTTKDARTFSTFAASTAALSFLIVASLASLIPSASALAPSSVGTSVTSGGIVGAHGGGDRRAFLSSSASSAAAVVAAFAAGCPPPSLAEDGDVGVEPFVRRGDGFAYTFLPPPGFAEGNKPLKTHLDEINFSKEGVRGYQYGITVDPVRISSLKEFGSPEEVAARVVTAEVNRDGIFEVTLAKDPLEMEGSGGAYAIEYISDGKRGKKRFLTRIYIQNKRLYVLTAQTKEEDFADREVEMAGAADTFRPL